MLSNSLALYVHSKIIDQRIITVYDISNSIGKNIQVTSDPSCPAGQLLIDKLPEMKSFWTSTIINADTGRTTYKYKTCL